MAQVKWGFLRKFLRQWFSAFRRNRNLWFVVRFMLPIILLGWLLDLTKYLKLESWRVAVKDAYFFAVIVVVAWIFAMVALRFAQKHGWWGLLRWKTLYFVFATAFIGLAWTTIAVIEGYQIKLVHILWWMLLGQAAAWFGIMIHLFAEES